MKRGAKRIVALFVIMLLLAVTFHNFLYLPPFIGMMTGLALLKFFGYYLKRTRASRSQTEAGDVQGFDIFDNIARAERSEERRVGKEGVSTCRLRWSTYH